MEKNITLNAVEEFKKENVAALSEVLNHNCAKIEDVFSEKKRIVKFYLLDVYNHCIFELCDMIRFAYLMCFLCHLSEDSSSIASSSSDSSQSEDNQSENNQSKHNSSVNSSQSEDEEKEEQPASPVREGGAEVNTETVYSRSTSLFGELSDSQDGERVSRKDQIKAIVQVC